MKGNIAIFASGRGSNAANLIAKANQHSYKVSLLVSNKKEAPVLEVANQNDIPSQIIDKQLLANEAEVLAMLADHKVEFIILAGFLLLLPKFLVEAYPNKIINIHPALLPKYGGKGMYGMNVHKAVFNNKEDKSGITIHLVNEEYDSGAILLQAAVDLDSSDEPEDISRKVLALEHHHFPLVVSQYISKFNGS